MRINELLTENQIDELSLGKKITTKAARFAQKAGDAIGGTLGGIQGAWDRGQRAYQRGKQVVDPEGNPVSSGGTNTTTSGGTNTTTSGGTNTTGVAATSSGKDPAALRQQAAELTQQADAIERSASAPAAPAAPAGTNTDSTGYDTQAGKPQGSPGNRQKGDIVKSGQNTFQYTGEPGKEWFVASGPLQEPNPQADRYNNIQAVGGKKYISAADARRTLQVSERRKLKKKMMAELQSNFLGMMI